MVVDIDGRATTPECWGFKVLCQLRLLDVYRFTSVVAIALAGLAPTRKGAVVIAIAWVVCA